MNSLDATCYPRSFRTPFYRILLRVPFCFDEVLARNSILSCVSLMFGMPVIGVYHAGI